MSFFSPCRFGAGVASVPGRLGGLPVKLGDKGFRTPGYFGK